MRVDVKYEHRETALKKIVEELHSALAKHGSGSYSSSIEGLGAITEEYHELVAAIRGHSRDEIIKEASQVAVTALWLIASIEADELGMNTR